MLLETGNPSHLNVSSPLVFGQGYVAMQLRGGKLGLARRSVQAHSDNSEAVNVRNGQI